MSAGTYNEWLNRWHLPQQAVIELLTILAPPDTSDSSEAAVQARVRLAAARVGVHLWRNNSGAATDASGRLVRYGLANDSARINAVLKSPDLIGLDRFGRFVAVECKRAGWQYSGTEREQAQAKFMTIVRSAGGAAGFVQSEGDFHAIVS